MDTNPTQAHAQRRLILIRHAKAVEEDAGGDHARPLATRGQQDAVTLGTWLADQGLLNAQIYCSTASRARQTLEGLGGNPPVILSDALYLASAGDMLATIHAADDANNTLILVGHNPGMHGLLALLAGSCANAADEDRLLLKFPTCACAVLEFSSAHWAAIATHSGHLAQLRFAA